MTRLRTTATKKRITYWEFSVEITGPRYETKAERRGIHRILSRKLLREIEELARLAVKRKLPPDFRAKVY